MRFVKWVALIVIAVFVLRWINRRTMKTEDDYAIENARKENTVEGYTRAVRYASDPEKRARLIEAFQDDLAKLHDAARAKLVAAHVPHPDGLDKLFVPLLARVDNVVSFVASPPVIDRASFEAAAARLAAPGVTVADYGETLEHQAACGSGIREAFKELLGSEAIDVSYELTAGPLPHVEAKYQVSVGSGVYTTKNGRRVFPGVHVKGSFDLVTDSGKLATIEMDDEPPGDISFTTDAMAGAFEGGSDRDIAYALVSGACKQSGYRLIAKLTGWSPPAAAAPERPATPTDSVAACEQSGASGDCLRAGRALARGEDGVTPDRAKAETLLKKGCEADGIESGDACSEYAVLVAERAAKLSGMPAMDLMGEARFTVESSCRKNHAVACARVGYLRLLDRADHTPATTFERHEALDFLVRACVLGQPDACERASTLVLDPVFNSTPFYGAAAALARKACHWYDAETCEQADKLDKAAGGKDAKATKIHDFALAGDRIFDVSWADWLDLDEGHAVFWIASSSDAQAIGARLGEDLQWRNVRIYDPANLPYGVSLGAAKNVKTVYAMFASQAGDKSTNPVCGECSGDAPPQFYVGGCTCLPLKDAKGQPKFKR